MCVLGVRHILNDVGESPLLDVFLAYDVISQKLPFAEGDEYALAHSAQARPCSTIQTVP